MTWCLFDEVAVQTSGHLFDELGGAEVWPALGNVLSDVTGLYHLQDSLFENTGEPHE